MTIRYTQVNPDVIYFLDDPVLMVDAQVGVDYRADLLPLVIDPDEDSLTFELIAGPNWLRVASDGTLSGVPTAGDVGIQAATVRVRDVDDGVLVAELLIRVLNATGELVLEPEEFQRIRLVWVDDPSTTLTVAWIHEGGSDAQVHYGLEDYGLNADAYAFTHKGKAAGEERTVINRQR